MSEVLNIKNEHDKSHDMNKKLTIITGEFLTNKKFCNIIQIH